MSLARRWRSQEFKPSRGDLLLAALTVLVTVSVLARAIYRDEPLTVLLIPAAVAAILLRRRRPVEALPIAVVVDSVSPDDRFLVCPRWSSSTLFVAGELDRVERLSAPADTQPPLTASAKVLDPLRVTTRRDQIFRALVAQEIHRGLSPLPGLAPPDLWSG